MAHDLNTNPILVGASTVVAAVDDTARGIVVPQQFESLTAAQFAPLRIDGPGSMADIFVDAVTDTESITWFGLLQN